MFDATESGTARWSHETRTVHEINITVTDGMLEAVTPGDEVRIVLQGRSGAVVKRLGYRELVTLLETK